MKVDGGHSIQEAQEAHNRGRYEHESVEAEPSEVQGDLHAEISSYVIKRLVPDQEIY